MEKRSQNSLVIAKLQELATSFFSDLQSHHPHLKSQLVRDLSTVLKRTDHEGIGFLTHSLPSLGKAIYRSFETRVFVCPSGFTKSKGTALPRFLGGLLKCCYEDDGKLIYGLDEACLVDLIQFCFFFYKLDLPYSNKLNKKVIDNFVEVELELGQLTIQDDQIIEKASFLVEKILEGFDPREITPRHGPGAVATGEKRENKWQFSRKYNNIHKVYPYYEYFVPSRASLLSRISWYKSLESHESGCAKVTLVPKDSRGPRLISMEPLEYQFIQQGLSKALVKHLEQKSSITRGRVNFTDQNINRNLSLWNSLSREYATLDMKEASDRVSLELVKRLFSKRPDVLRALLATRTTHTQLPDGTCLELSKFAPMGSALCFPVEALVFFCLSETIRKEERIGGKTYVYGDDIVVNQKLTPHLFKLFPSYGLKFNEDKCFISGYFRESCGLDAYRGIVCTPVRLRSILPRSRKEASALVSAVELSNALFLKGYWKTAKYVELAVKSQLFVDVLKSPKQNFGGLAFASFTTKGVITGSRTSVRYRKDLQHYEARVNLAYQPSKRRDIRNDARLFSNLVNQRQTVDVVPHATAVKMRWYPIFG